MFFGTSDSETTKDKWLQFVLTNVIPLLISKDDHFQKNEFIFYLHLDYWQSEIRFKPIIPGSFSHITSLFLYTVMSV